MISAQNDPFTTESIFAKSFLVLRSTMLFPPNITLLTYDMSTLSSEEPDYPIKNCSKASVVAFSYWFPNSSPETIKANSLSYFSKIPTYISEISTF